MSRTVKFFKVALVALLLPGCFHVQLNGSVADAELNISALRSPTTVLDSATTIGPDFWVLSKGQQKWDSWGPFLQHLFIGISTMRNTGYDLDELYLLTAENGHDFDRDRDGNLDDSGDWVVGPVRAIISGARLEQGDIRVSALTEAAYVALEPYLGGLSDAEIVAQLDSMARNMVPDLNESGSVTYDDVIHWSRLSNASSYLGDLNAVNAFSEAVADGESETYKAALADAVVAAGTSAYVTTGEWSNSGGSDDPTAVGNKVHNITVAGAQSVDFSLASSVDTVLFLLDDSGAVVASNDDDADSNSRIYGSLGAGSYQLVAATYFDGESGTYVLRLQGATLDDYGSGGGTDGEQVVTIGQGNLDIAEENWARIYSAYRQVHLTYLQTIVANSSLAFLDPSRTSYDEFSARYQAVEKALDAMSTAGEALEEILAPFEAEIAATGTAAGLTRQLSPGPQAAASGDLIAAAENHDAVVRRLVQQARENPEKADRVRNALSKMAADDQVLSSLWKNTADMNNKLYNYASNVKVGAKMSLYGVGLVASGGSASLLTSVGAAAGTVGAADSLFTYANEQQEIHYGSVGVEFRLPTPVARGAAIVGIATGGLADLGANVFISFGDDVAAAGDKVINVLWNTGDKTVAVETSERSGNLADHGKPTMPPVVPGNYLKEAGDASQPVTVLEADDFTQDILDALDEDLDSAYEAELDEIVYQDPVDDGDDQGSGDLDDEAYRPWLLCEVETWNPSYSDYTYSAFCRAYTTDTLRNQDLSVDEASTALISDGEAAHRACRAMGGSHADAVYGQYWQGTAPYRDACAEQCRYYDENTDTGCSVVDD